MFFAYAGLAALLTLNHVAIGASVYSQELCLTKIGTVSAQHVPSSTITITIPLSRTTKTTVTPGLTITPAPTTTTTTTTTTLTSTSTAPTVTDTTTTTTTASVTLTSTETDTETDTATATATTTSTSTSVVPTPAGFTPISQEPGYVPKIKGRSIHGLDPRANKNQNTLKCVAGPKGPVFSPALYPSSVSCVVFLEVITTTTVTVTAARTTTTIPTATSTATSTISTTTTSTVTPADVTSTVTASTTSTFSVTTDATTTTSTTVTTTSTSIVPGPTTYDACASNNIIGSANGGQGIDEIDGSGSQSFSGVNADSAYDCCVACQQTTGCAGSIFYDSCTLIQQGTCTPGQSNPAMFETNSGFGPGGGFVLSNGPCGTIANGGSNG